MPKPQPIGYNSAHASEKHEVNKIANATESGNNLIRPANPNFILSRYLDYSYKYGKSSHKSMLNRLM